MNKKDLLTKILAIGGTVLIWLPILAPVLFSLLRLLTGRIFNFDYLMPAELFPLAVAGGGLLIWAAVREHSRLSIILWGLVIAVGMLFAGSNLAEITGLATGQIEPTGWQWALVVASLVIYTLAVVVVGIGGVLLLRDLFRKESVKAPG